MAWSTKLITAIIFATITISSLSCRFLTLQGARENSYTVCRSCLTVRWYRVDRGDDVHSFLGYFLLNGQTSMRSSSGASKVLQPSITGSANGELIIAGRCWLGSFILLAAGGLAAAGSKRLLSKDLFTFTYLDVWLAEDAPLSATNEAAGRLKKWCATRRRNMAGASRERWKPREILESLTLLSAAAGHGSGSRSRLNCRS